METKKEAFKKFVIEQLKDFDYWGEASPEGYAETIVDEAVKLFCQPVGINTDATMESKETNWNDLTLKERLALVHHNEQLDLYSVSGSYFAVNAFVRCKNNGIIRYITEQNGKTFKDDGKVSGCEPSPFCHYEDYVMI